MTALGTLERPPVRPAPACAVTWINGREAIVARTNPSGVPSTRRLLRHLDDQTRYLARVVHAIGDCERVVILGPGSTKLALEREYVSIYHRPERLVDVEPAGPTCEADLAQRLATLAS
jgi:hypothetical protein